ncbi:hypothetical protein [Microcoleus sp. N9_A1]|uniref:hypothetical protein n=1 Tax=Microcoleus sp. N9_A1 TaxID=3055380 RepID=UPI002FD0E53C
MPAAKIGLCKAVVPVVDAATTTTTNETVYFRSNTLLYTGDFATAVGISVAGPGELSKPAMPVKNLIRGGQLSRMVAVTKATATNPSTQVKILVSTNKTPDARSWPDGTKTLPGSSAGPITAVRNANRMRLS